MASTPVQEAVDSPVLSLFNKRLHALKKKYNRILQMEESIAQGKPINKEQEEELDLALRCQPQPQPSSPSVLDSAENHESQEGGDDAVEDLLNLLYFGSLFDVKPQVDFTATMLSRAYDTVTDEATDLLGVRGLDLISMLGGLLVSQPPHSSLSYKNALQKCIEHAKLWLSNSDSPIDPNAGVSCTKFQIEGEYRIDPHSKKGEKEQPLPASLVTPLPLSAANRRRQDRPSKPTTTLSFSPQPLPDAIVFSRTRSCLVATLLSRRCRDLQPQLLATRQGEQLENDPSKTRLQSCPCQPQAPLAGAFPTHHVDLPRQSRHRLGLGSRAATGRTRATTDLQPAAPRSSSPPPPSSFLLACDPRSPPNTKATTSLFFLSFLLSGDTSTVPSGFFTSRCHRRLARVATLTRRHLLPTLPRHPRLAAVVPSCRLTVCNPPPPR
ncbi:hypothetical protein Tsubulata_046553 [Turnera subulata]|uniref:Uncharacterized protein n=1 Tax=Turnera subulata TaxID=218843 RepID=A0A9Q0FCA6_9ROSI|nr:hypothetical protein Tsubulata_046553 [Turnera subulata]